MLYVNFVTCFVISSGLQRNTILQYLVELLCFFLNYSIKMASKHIFGNQIFDFILTWLQFCNIQILFIFRLSAYTKLNYQFYKIVFSDVLILFIVNLITKSSNILYWGHYYQSRSDITMVCFPYKRLWVTSRIKT